MIVDTRDPATYEPPEYDETRHHLDIEVGPEPWWRGPLVFLVATVGGLALVAAVLFAVAISQDQDATDHPVERSTFTDAFGRQCTQVRAGDAIALDCDGKPVESRLGSLLEGTGQ